MAVRTLPSRSPVGLFIVLGLLIIAFAGFFYWLGGRGAIRLTDDDKAIAGITEKIVSGKFLSPAEERKWQEMQEQGLAVADQLLKQGEFAPVAPAVIPGFKTGPWKGTFQTKYGSLRVFYIVAPALESRIESRPVIENGRLKIYLRNISSEPVDSVAFLTWRDRKGEILGVNNPTRNLSPNETEDDIGGAVKGAVSVEVVLK